MSGVMQDIQFYLTELRRLTSTEFAAIAFGDNSEQTIQWKLASGNRNDRYKRIVLRNGKGIPGKVLRTGRSLVTDSFMLDTVKDPFGDVIFISEDLKSAICAPLVSSDHVKGVLLIGSRSKRLFHEETVELVKSFAEQIGVLIQ